MSRDTQTLPAVLAYTDGACSGNPGPGGWAVILRYQGRERELSGFEPDSTNQRMEIRAAIEALRALTTRCSITLVSDSAYVIGCFNDGWRETWIAKGWRNSKKKPIANRDLWEELFALVDQHEVTFTKTEGHAGDPLNERCDKLAVAAYSRTR